MFRLNHEDILQLDSGKSVQDEKNETNAHYVIVTGAGSNACNGMYVKINRRHNDEPVYCQGNGYCISKESIGNQQGYVIGKWPQVMYGKVSTSMYEGEWHAYFGAAPLGKVTPLNQNKLLMCGRLKIQKQGDDEWQPVWASVKGFSVYICEEDGSSVLYELKADICKIVPDVGNAADVFIVTQAHLPPLIVSTSNTQEMLLWISTFSVLQKAALECPRRDSCHVQEEPIKKKNATPQGESKNEQLVEHFRTLKSQKEDQERKQAEDEAAKLEEMDTEEREKYLEAKSNEEAREKLKHRMLKSQLGGFVPKTNVKAVGRNRRKNK